MLINRNYSALIMTRYDIPHPCPRRRTSMSDCGAEGRPWPSARVGDDLRYLQITTSFYPLRKKPFNGRVSLI